MRILEEERNCWRKCRVERLGALIDGAEYFEAFVSAVEKAERSLYIAAWDVDSRMNLLRRGKSDEGLNLRELLLEAVGARPELHVYILTWDFAVIYAVERDWSPIFDLGWRTHERIHFRLDSHHPIGASQHQKIVVADERIAFCGGLDLTKERWDTSEHRLDDSRRLSPYGKRYGPYHDLQIVMEGEAASALGDLFRERWWWATGERLDRPEAGGSSPWPDGVDSILTDGRIALSRTFSGYKGRPEVREIERLYLDFIERAENYIYLENQYFTSYRVFQALKESLDGAEGPEIVFVLPRRTKGWLEQRTMGVIRERFCNELVQYDRHRRLRLCYPAFGDDSVYVHAKAAVVDGRAATVGSANLSNRSMGLDSECNIAIEGDGRDDESKAARWLLSRLMSEHLGAKSEEIAECLDETGSLIRTVERFSEGERRLLPLKIQTEEEINALNLIDDPTLLDPEKPVELDLALDFFVSDEGEKPGYPVILPAVVLAVMLGMAAVWRWTPLAEWLDLGRIVAAAQVIKGQPWAPFAVIGAYLLAGVAVVPITLMIGATALIFDPVWAAFYAMTGTLANAVLSYWVGRIVGRGAVRRLAGSKLNRISRWLSRRGIISVAIMRNIPVAPFAVVNMVAGSSHIRFKDFLIGTFIGMAPGILAITIFVDRLVEALRDPNWATIGLAAAAALVIGAGAWWIRRRITRNRQE